MVVVVAAAEVVVVVVTVMRLAIDDGESIGEGGIVA